MRSIAIWVRLAPLRGIGPHRIDAASFVGSTRTRHTLLVRRKLAVAGISGLASLQAILILDRRSGRRRHCSEQSNSGNGRQGAERKMTVHHESLIVQTSDASRARASDRR